MINFRDWPIERAREYPDCFEIVERLVMPERTRKRPDGEFQLRSPLYDRWWHYGDKRPELYATIAGLDRVLVTAAVSPTFAIVFVPTTIILAHKLVALIFSGTEGLGLLQSNVHRSWAVARSSTLGGVTLNYSPSDCMETFPLPNSLGCIEDIGERYDQHRKGIMAARLEGLTATYNRFHRRAEAGEDIRQLRTLQVEMDYAVAAAYGWTDLDFSHDFHETKQGLRYTISEAARLAVLDRLLALNHARHTEELASAPAAKQKRAGKKKSPTQNTLF